MSLQRDVQKIIILVMKYTNVSTRFYNITVESKNKHKIFKNKINCGLIHFLFVKMRKTKFTLNPKKNLLTFKVEFQNFHKVFFR